MEKFFVKISVTGAAFLLAFSVLAASVSAQYGPPEGFSIPEGMGPPAGVEEMQRRGEEMEKKGAEMQKAGLSKMKKGAPGMRKAITQMEKTIDKVTKAGYEVAQEIKDSLASGKAAVDTIETTSDMDEAIAAIDAFNAFIEVLDANVERLNVLANFPRILKQADRTYQKLIKNFEKAKAKLAKSSVDLTETVAAIQTRIDNLKAAVEQAKEAAKNGDSETAFAKLENEYFEPMEDAFQSVGMLEAALNISRAVKSVEKGIASATKIALKLKKKGEDVSGLESILRESEAKLGELSTMTATKNFDPEPAVDLLEALDELRASFENSVEEISGKDLHGAKTVNFFNVQVPNVPKEFMNGIPQGEPGDSGFKKLDFGF